MSDILDDLKMMADHLDRENADEHCELGLLLIRAIAEIRKQRGELHVGEVSMPEHDMRGPTGTGVYFNGYTPHALRTYGEQCRAAGYAAGVAEAGKDAYRYRWISSAFQERSNGWHLPAITITGAPSIETLDDAIDAALRMEVKP